MPRTARIVVPDMPHHVTQRGNHHEPVFFSADDYQRYHVWLGEHARREGLRVWAYCLMPNHIHLVVVPAEAGALARFMGSLQALHTQRINADHGWSGHIWHSRYYSCVMDETHPAAVVRYVERNPVRAKLVGPAPDYAWSSAPAHSGLRKDPALSDDLPLLAAVSDWRRWLQGEDHPAVLARLRDCTGKDLPYGEPSFVEQIAQRLGRPLTKRPRGRPKKTEGVAAETGPE